MAKFLRSKGYEAVHIKEISTKRQKSILDDEIRKFLLSHDAVLITKDHGFVRSYFRVGVPEKILFIHGDMNRDETLRMFEVHLDTILKRIAGTNLLELSPAGFRIIT